MPYYDYRCEGCGQDSTLFFKTYTAYDAAQKLCPYCGSAQLIRRITRVTVAKPGRDYTHMSSQEMLSVMESGDSRQVGEMFRQVGAGVPETPAVYHETTERLLRGDSMESVERDLRGKTQESGAAGDA